MATRSNKRYYVTIILIGVVSLFILAIGLAIWYYYKTLFVPSRCIQRSFNNDYDDIYIGTTTGRWRKNCKVLNEHNINARYYEIKDSLGYPSEHIILFFHGNIGNISHRSYVVNLCQEIKYSLLLVDYRGYGKSDSAPSPGNILEDGKVAYEWLRKRYDSNRIIVWGESMGGPVASYVASIKQCRALVLLSTFSAISDIVEVTDMSNWSMQTRKMINYILEETNFDIKPRQYLRHVTCPVLFIHSTEDELIPYSLAKINYQATKSRHKELVTIKGGHSTPLIENKQFETILAFLGIKRHQLNVSKLAQGLNSIDTSDW